MLTIIRRVTHSKALHPERHLYTAPRQVFGDEGDRAFYLTGLLLFMPIGAFE